MAGYGQFCPIAATADVLTERVIEHQGNEYVLTPAGEQLRPIVEQMAVWGERWIRRTIRREDADAAFLMTDLCLTDPGYGTDLIVRSDPVVLASVYMGDIGLPTALRNRKITLEGPSHLVRSFPEWFGLSSLIGVRQS